MFVWRVHACCVIASHRFKIHVLGTVYAYSFRQELTLGISARNIVGFMIKHPCLKFFANNPAWQVQPKMGTAIAEFELLTHPQQNAKSESIDKISVGEPLVLVCAQSIQMLWLHNQNYQLVPWLSNTVNNQVQSSTREPMHSPKSGAGTERPGSLLLFMIMKSLPVLRSGDGGIRTFSVKMCYRALFRFLACEDRQQPLAARKTALQLSWCERVRDWATLSTIKFKVQRVNPCTHPSRARGQSVLDHCFTLVHDHEVIAGSEERRRWYQDFFLENVLPCLVSILSLWRYRQQPLAARKTALQG